MSVPIAIELIAYTASKLMIHDPTRRPALSQRIDAWAAAASEWLVDLIFPRQCLACGKADTHICIDCVRELELEVIPQWTRALNRVCATGWHSDEVLRAAVRAFKYEGDLAQAASLAERMIDALDWLDWHFDIIVPIPLHSERLRERGYNQSELLADIVAAELDIYCATDCVVRVRNTEQQATLKGADRKRNVQGAFEVMESVEGLRILLVDDVVTSGETISACAGELREHGAAAVYGIAVSMGGRR